MPLIIVGADTPIGASVVGAVTPREGEVRVFVTEPEAAERYKAQGIKVAVGDVSDGSHVGGAALNAFCAVLIEDAAVDDRERSFAGSPDEVIAGWAEGLADAGVTRALWVGATPLPQAIRTAVRESAAVATAGTPPEAVAARVAELEDVAELRSEY